MIMEYIEGTSMTHEIFEAKKESDRRTILQRLGEQLQLLRSVEPEGHPYYGRVNHQGWCRSPGFLDHMKPGFQGPYDAHEEFMKAFYEAMQYRIATSCPDGDYDGLDLRYLKGIKNVLGCSQHRQPKLTHFDPKW